MDKVMQEVQMADWEEKAYALYNQSVNMPTTIQKRCVSQLKQLHDQYPTDEIADYYAMALFNLSLRESPKEICAIAEKLENLFQTNATENIAERIGRIKYNLTACQELNSDRLKKYAEEIEYLYHLYPTVALAEPLAKIWHSISKSKAKNHSDYAQKVLSICPKLSNPETNEAYANVLFDSKNSIQNREHLIDSFLSGTQSLASFGYYLESEYYPLHNAALENFKLHSGYPIEQLGKKINKYFDRLKKFPDHTNLKAELLAILFYTLEIKRLLIVPHNTDAIGHYSKVENLKYVVAPPEKSGTLRMFNAAYMNDPSEGLVLPKFLLGEDSQIINSNLPLSSNIYLSCFTTAIDQLPMWSMYGNDGTGCCLILKKDFFDYSSENLTDEMILGLNCNYESNFLYRICYLSHTARTFTVQTEKFFHDIPKLEQKLNDAILSLKTHIDNVTLLKSQGQKKLIDEILMFILDQIRYLFKDEHYAHERELRLIRYSETPQIDENSWIVPQLYVEVKKPLEYEKIILGPKVTQSNRIVPYLLYSHKVKAIEKSKITYR